MTFSLNPTHSSDVFARMFYRFEKEVDDDHVEYKIVVADEDEAMAEGEIKDGYGWIDFWDAGAKACKAKLKRASAGLAVIMERREKRKSTRGDVSVADAQKEMEETTNLVVKQISHRVKAWSLINTEGARHDDPPTDDDAFDLMKDESINLYEVASKFCAGKQEFTRKPSTS